MIIAKSGRIEEARGALGWTQGELSRQSGVSRATICAMETGRKAVKAPTAKKICDAIGRNFADIFLSVEKIPDE